MVLNMLTTQQVAEMLQELFNKRRKCVHVKCEDPSGPLYDENAIMVNTISGAEYIYYKYGQSYITIHDKYDPSTSNTIVSTKFHFRDPEFADKLIKRLRP